MAGARSGAPAAAARAALLLALLGCATLAAAAAGSVPRRSLLQRGARLVCSKEPNYVQPPRGQPAPPVKIVGNQLVANGKPVYMHAVNWFGFNNRMTFLNGLWAGQASMNSDFAAIAWQFKLLGFNAVRLPFLFEDLRTPAAKIQGYCTHESSLADMANRTLDPAVPRAAIRRAPPTPPVPLPRVTKPGSCNTYIPPLKEGGLTMDRFLWTIQWFAANGFYVLIDWHPMGMERTSHNVSEFVAEWRNVWSQVSCLPNFRRDLEGRVLVDIFNEPDSQWQGWQPKDGKAGMTELYLGAMDALWALTPSEGMLFLVNGGGQGNYSGINWGNGFVTDRSLIARDKLSDANPFFIALMSKPYLNNVVISPHLYGPSVSHRKDWFAGPAWMESLDKSFGYLNAQGYCYRGKCKTFPIWVGEFGSRFQEAEDMVHLTDLARYLNSDTPGHKAIRNWAYWAWNANSGDTGGLVDDSWMNLEWVKLRWLRNNLGLRPWWA